MGGMVAAVKMLMDVAGHDEMDSPPTTAAMDRA